MIGLAGFASHPRQWALSQDNDSAALGDISGFEKKPPFPVIRNAKRSYVGNIGGDRTHKTEHKGTET
jgi:hypothetical protein